MKRISLLQTSICIILFVSISAILSSCVKTPDDNPPVSTTSTSTTSTTTNPPKCDTCLPPVTMEGRNTFGCKINGKVWLPNGGPFSYDQRVTYGKKALSIGANELAKGEFVTIQLKEIIDTGYYSFPDNDFIISLVEYNKTSDGGGGSSVKFKSNPIDNGYFHLTRLNLISGFVSGTFALDLYDSEQDTLHITDGRFDIHF